MEKRGLELGLALLEQARGAGVDVYMYAGRLAVWGSRETWPIVVTLRQHEFEVLAALQRAPVAREAWNQGAGDADLPYTYRAEALPEQFGAAVYQRLLALKARAPQIER